MEIKGSIAMSKTVIGEKISSNGHVTIFDIPELIDDAILKMEKQGRDKNKGIIAKLLTIKQEFVLLQKREKKENLHIIDGSCTIVSVDRKNGHYK